MPYISKDRRPNILDVYPCGWTYGDFNYFVTNTIKNFIEVKGESYELYNSLIGMLECCKLELYRRKVALYEDQKIEQNGDVYE